MKKMTAIILALCLVCLCGCGAALPEEPGAAETAAPATTEPAAGTPELSPILTEIRERMHPGTAGSSLTAAQLAVMLLDWCVQTDWEDEQIRTAVEAFVAPMAQREGEEFALQMASVRGAVDVLLSEDGEALLGDIGGTEGTLWPWPDAPTEKLDAVFSAAGTEDSVTD